MPTIQLTVEELASIIDRQSGAYNQLPKRDQKRVAALYSFFAYDEAWNKLIDAYQESR